MGFGDLTSNSGLQSLDCYLATRSYIEGYVPSQADVAVLEAVGQAPDARFVNALRWYNHMNSYSPDEKLAFPGVQRPVTEYGPKGGQEVPPAESGEVEEDDFDLFGDDDDEEEDEAAEKLKQERLAAYAAKKAKKPAVVAKSNIILDVKPWDDETDMKEIENAVRSITKDGLLWGASKLVPLAYGIQKLQISCVVEDEKVGTDFLEEAITEFEDLVQSVDIAAFNKV